MLLDNNSRLPGLLRTDVNRSGSELQVKEADNREAKEKREVRRWFCKVVRKRTNIFAVIWREMMWKEMELCV